MSDEEIISALQDDDLNNKFIACANIDSKDDTVFVKYLLENINDVRITHHIRFKGMSVYQVTVGALKRISGLEPPMSYNYQYNSRVVRFYHDWAVANNYIENKQAIN